MAAAAAVTRVVSVAAVTPLGRPSVAATATVVVAARMLDGRLLPSGIGSMTSSSMGLGIRNSFPLSQRFGVAFCRHQGCNVYLGLRTSIEAALQHATHTLRPVGTRVLPAGVDARGCADATGRRYNAVKALLALASHRDGVDDTPCNSQSERGVTLSYFEQSNKHLTPHNSDPRRGAHPSSRSGQSWAYISHATRLPS